MADKSGTFTKAQSLKGLSSQQALPRSEASPLADKSGTFTKAQSLRGLSSNIGTPP